MFINISTKPRTFPLNCESLSTVVVSVADSDNFPPYPDPGSGFQNSGSGSCLNLTYRKFKIFRSFTVNSRFLLADLNMRITNCYFLNKQV